MAKRPRVSVVMPTYDQAQYLREAIDSVVAQSVDDWELIVVNNYSDDDTVDVVNSYHDARITLINYRNHGIIGAARNRGIERARGEWVAFLDSDDVWHAKKLEKCLQAVEGSRTDLVGHGMVFVRNGTRLRKHGSGPLSRLRFKRLLLGINALTPSAVMVRKRCLMDVGCFSEREDFVTAEDYDLWLKLAKHGVRPMIIDDCLTDYRIHDSNTSGSIERHALAGIAVMNAHYASLDRASWVDALRRRRGRAMIYYAAAKRFDLAGLKPDATVWYRKSFNQFPFNIRNCFAFLTSCFG